VRQLVRRWIIASALAGAPALAGCAGDGSSGEVDTDAGGGADAAQDDGLPRSCEGIDCAGPSGSPRGTCALDDDGYARCLCDNPGLLCQLFPTADFRCLTGEEYCAEAGAVCDAEGAYCRIDVTLPESTCWMEEDICLPDRCGERTEPGPGTWRDSLPVASCACQGPFRFDETDSACEPDASKCEPVTLSSTPRWSLEISGAAEFQLLDGGGANYNWGSGGHLAVFNHWPHAHCGSLAYTGGSKGPGTFAIGELAITLTHGDRSFTSTDPGASGSVSVTQLAWCGTFDCTEVDVEISGTLASGDGETVTVTGTVTGTF
jgi:hypothetical protein